MTQKQLTQINNPLNKEFINSFHGLGLPLHFNHYGNKEFSNYQRVALIILFQRSKKSLRDFAKELCESLWTKWLNLKKVPKKSMIHLWLKLFNMKHIRMLNSILLSNKTRLTAVDGTGFDSWQRSRHYAKRIGEPNMPYAKADLFVDVKTKEILDFSLYCDRIADVRAAEYLFKRSKIRGFTILADGAYDSEPLHELVRSKGARLFAPVRKRNKRSNKKNPKGKYRRECLELPEFQGMRSIVETVNFMIKKTQISCLKSKKKIMKQKEFGWQVVVHNLKRKILLGDYSEKQEVLFLFIVKIQLFWTTPLIFSISAKLKNNPIFSNEIDSFI